MLFWITIFCHVFTCITVVWYVIIVTAQLDRLVFQLLFKFCYLSTYLCFDIIVFFTKCIIFAHAHYLVTDFTFMSLLFCHVFSAAGNWGIRHNQECSTGSTCDRKLQWDFGEQEQRRDTYFWDTSMMVLCFKLFLNFMQCRYSILSLLFHFFFS